MLALLIPFCVWFSCPDPPEFVEPPPVVAESPKPAVESMSILQVNEPEPQYTRSDKWPADVEQWRPLVAGHFPEDQVETALCVMNGESKGNPKARNKSSGAAGLWQFIPSTWDKMVVPALDLPSYASDGPYSPEQSTFAAAWLQRTEGWSQWSAYRRCKG